MSKFGNALRRLQEAQPENSPESVQIETPENLKAGLQENGSSGPAAGPEREKYSTYLDTELVKAIKLYAVHHRMKHHQVVEAALRAYLGVSGTEEETEQ